MRKAVIGGLFLGIAASLSARVPDRCLNTATPGPKYKAGPCHEELGGASCTHRCAAGPMVISPSPIETCEDKPIRINVRIEGGRMSTFGDRIENSGGEIDWGDGSGTLLNLCDSMGKCSPLDLTHTYSQASTYFISTTFGEQHNNANNPPGGCSYRCRLQQADTVVVHLKTSEQCKP